ncbi:MAG: NUDIX hydrolase [Candidatus Kapabacteria bacterium]|nr:NUDIX hydrolase [Candidatus Kapabacteria bacterium]
MVATSVFLSSESMVAPPMHDNSSNREIAHWETVDEHATVDWKVVRLRSVTRVHPQDGRQGRFTVAEAPSWVNIIPITNDGMVVCVRQFRHGVSQITIEIPGGVVSHGEDPRLAAERECREETGYAGDGEASLLGIVEPNPAFMTNSCYTYIWHGCTWRGPQELDPNEEIDVVLMTVDELRNMVRTGEIRHSLVLSALALFQLHHHDR